MSLIVTPWINAEEFKLVARWISEGTSQGWRLAVQRIQVWRNRVDRLPTGVETTLPLIQAFLSCHDYPNSANNLTISTAITRFLNLIGHVGERKLGHRKLMEAASAFAIPSWLVDLRHEHSHGEVPNIHRLKDGLSFCLSWIIENFWNDVAEFLDTKATRPLEYITKSKDYAFIHDMLDCYGYLKLYGIWGTKSIGELHDQPELVEHLSKLWRSFQQQNASSTNNKKRKRLDIESILIADAINTLEIQLKKAFLNSSNKSQIDTQKSIIHALVHEELLVPGEEFLKSLKQEENFESKEDGSKLPDILVAMWIKVLEYAAMAGIIPAILTELYDLVRSGTNSRSSRQVAALWIIKISELCANPENVNDLGQSKKRKKKKVKKIVNNDCESVFTSVAYECGTRDFVDYCLEQPCEYLEQIFSAILKLRTPSLSKTKEIQIKDLITAFLGRTEFEKSAKITTLGDVQSVSYLTKSDSNPWSEDPECWKNVPIGNCSGDEPENYESKTSRIFERNENIHRLDWDGLRERYANT